MDQRIGELVDWLENRNQLDKTYLFITADHGEYFGQHGLEKHYYGMYEPVLHVPLVVHGLGESKENVSEPVTLADLYPTIIEIATGTSPELPQAISLRSSDKINSREYVFAELGAVAPDGISNHHPDFDNEGYGIPTQVVRDDTFKLIRRQDGHTELYRWQEDPVESQDLSDSNLETTSNLINIIDEQLDDLSREVLSEDIEDPDLKKHLEDLGYI
jgi:arylsulfatase A-like enzyme